MNFTRDRFTVREFGAVGEFGVSRPYFFEDMDSSAITITSDICLLH